MFSLNVPLPGTARRRIEDLRPYLSDFETVREEPTLVVKRFGERAPEAYARLEKQVRAAVRGTAPFEVRLDGLDAFEAPAAGPAPVVYLAVESPGLATLHASLVDTFDAVSGIEGEAYVPHVTLARGGDVAALESLEDIPVEPIEWTVTELWLWDDRLGEPAARLSLSV